MKKLASLLASSAFVLGVASVAVAADPVTQGNYEYGKHDAFGLTMGKQEMTDCKINWQDPTTHKTYCFTSEQNKESWAKDTKGNIAKADAGFAKVAGEKTTTHAPATTH